MNLASWEYILVGAYSFMILLAVVTYCRSLIKGLLTANRTYRGLLLRLMRRFQRGDLARRTGASLLLRERCPDFAPNRILRARPGHRRARRNRLEKKPDSVSIQPLPVLVVLNEAHRELCWCTIEQIHPRILPRFLVVLPRSHRKVLSAFRIEPRTNIRLFNTNGLPKVAAERFPFDNFLEEYDVFSDPGGYLRLRERGVLRALRQYHNAHSKPVTVEARSGELVVSVPFKTEEYRLASAFEGLLELAFELTELLDTASQSTHPCEDSPPDAARSG